MSQKETVATILHGLVMSLITCTNSNVPVVKAKVVDFKKAINKLVSEWLPNRDDLGCDFDFLHLEEEKFWFQVGCFEKGEVKSCELQVTPSFAGFRFCLHGADHISPGEQSNIVYRFNNALNQTYHYDSPFKDFE